MLVRLLRSRAGRCLRAYFDDVESFVDGGFHVEGKSCVDFCRYFSGDNLQDLLSEFDEEAVEGCVNLLVHVFALRWLVFQLAIGFRLTNVVLAILDSNIHQLGILRLLRCC